MTETIDQTVERIMDRGKREPVRVEDIRESDDPQRSFVDEDRLVELKQSIDAKGLIQPIGVLNNSNGQEIIWGSRRLQALKELGIETADAVVFEGISHIEAWILRIAENLHQDHIVTIDEEDDIYNAWQEYQKTPEEKRGVGKPGRRIYEYAHEIGISEDKMVRIVKHVEQRRGDTSPEVQNALSSDLDETNRLAEWPELRRQLLASKQSGDGIIGGGNLRIAARAIQEAPEEYKKPLADLMTEGKLIPEREPKNSKVLELANVLNEVPSDVQELLIKQAISPDMARELAGVTDEAEREQLIAERKAIVEEQEFEKEQHDKDITEAKSGKKAKTKRRSKKEVAILKKENYIEHSLYNLHVDALATVRADHINSITDQAKRDLCFDYVRRIRDLCDRTLQESDVKYDEITEGEQYA